MRSLTLTATEHTYSDANGVEYIRIELLDDDVLDMNPAWYRRTNTDRVLLPKEAVPALERMHMSHQRNTEEANV